MRVLKLLVVAAIAVCMLAATAGCGKPRLDAPSGLNVDSLELTLNWNIVNGAAYYTIRIDGNGERDEIMSGTNSYSLEGYAPGEYKITVRAEAGANISNSSSAWSKALTFTRPYENGLLMELIDSNTAFSVTGAGTASGEIVIPDYYRGLPVTAVADRAFINNTQVTSITLGNNVKSIGEYAFAGCSSMTDLSLNDGLESIGGYAFQNCRQITNLTIPDSVTAMGERAFQYCRGIASLTLGSGLTSISDYAFNNCVAIETLNIPSNVTAIGTYAFNGCNNLKTVNTGNAVTTIGAYAFSDCTSITSLTIGTDTESLGEGAFNGCTALAEVAMPENLTDIGDYAFNGCTSLATVSISENTKRIGRSAFTDTQLWKANAENYVGDWFIGASYAEDAYTIKAPREGTVGIADYAYSKFKTASTVILPDSVKYIGKGAFYQCQIPGVVIGSGAVSIGESAFAGTNLGLVVLGALDQTSGGANLGASSLEDIGNEAFKDCAQLNTIEIPSTVEHIGTYAFKNSGIWKETMTEVYAGNWLVGYNESGTLNTIAVDDGTVGIADYVFYNQTGILTVTIPEGVKYIGRSAFNGCKNLAGVTLPDSLTEIEDYTFYNCTALALPELPANLTRIGRSAFYKCALGSASRDTDMGDILTIPQSVTEIGAYAFYGCGFEYEDPNATGSEQDRLKEGGIDIINIGDNITEIGDFAFYNMGSLKQVNMGANVERIGQRAFYKCEQLTTVNFSDSLKTIGERAFYGCSSLTAAILPSSVTQIDAYAFYKCTSLARATFGNAESIGDYAFFGCTSLKEIALPSTLESIGTQAFRNCSALTGITLGSNIREIGAHAFYGCNTATFYAQGAEPAEGWNSRWNSSYRVVVWNSVISEEGYLVSFVYDSESIDNLSASTVLTAPVRNGYTFEGFATVPGGAAVYSPDNLGSVTDGTTLYAVWTRI